MDARRTFPKRERAGGPLIYINKTMAGEERKLTADHVLHLKGLGNGIVGRSVISLARESMGLSLAAEKTGAAFFGNGTRLSGVLETDGTLGETGVTNLKKSWGEHHQGAGNTGSVPVLEEGVKWKPMSIPPDDAQFLETRQFQVVDVARWFNVPPHLLYDLSRATFSNIDSQQIQFVQYTLMPWLVKWETILRWRLETDAEKDQRIFPQIDVRALLRGDVKARFTGYKLGIDAGWLTREDVRRLEDLDPKAGLEKPLKQMNMDTIDVDGNTEAKPVAAKPAAAEPAPEPEDESEAEEEPSATDAERAAAVVRSHLPSMMHIAGKLLRREAKAA
ncbi:MAG: phage portal protein, partial [Actinomycetota bacterium]|nr:phage portal protein [Actinomycetota bacterium]